MVSTNLGREILKRQLVDVNNNSDLGFSVGLTDENDIYKWSVCFTGPEGTLYEGGFFKALLKFPNDFPQNPPEMRFVSEMWHPNSKFI